MTLPRSILLVSESPQRVFFPLILGLFIVAIYGNSLLNGYNIDDELVTRHHRLTSKGVAAIPDILESAYYQDDAGYTYDYRPLVHISFAIEHQFFGESAFTGHLVNLMLYILLCMLIYYALQKLSHSITPLMALCIVLLFAAHTSHTEVVCSLKNRDELLSGVFAFAALYVAVGSKRGISLVGLLFVPAFFCMALLSKPTIVAFLPVLLTAIVLFTEVPLWWVLLVAAAGTVPLFTVVSVSNAHYKLLFFAFLCLYVCVIYSAINYSKVKVWVLYHYSIGFRAIRGNSEFSYLQNLFKGIMPPVSYIHPTPLFLSLFSVVVYAAAWCYHMYWLGAIAGIYLIFNSVLGTEMWRWWHNVALMLLLTGTLFFMPITFSSFYSGLSVSFLSFIVFWGNRRLFIPAALSLAVIVLTQLVVLGDFIVALVALVGAMRYAVFRKYVWVIIAGLLITYIYSCVQVYPHFNKLILSNPDFRVLLALLLLSLLFGRYAGGVSYFYALIAIILFLLLGYKFGNAVGITEAVGLAERKLDSFTIVKSQLRPIDFTEQPVTVNSAMEKRVGTALVVLVHYFCKTLVPYPLAYYYGYRFIEPTSVFGATAFWGALIYLVLLGGCLYSLFNNRLLAFVLVIYLSQAIAFSGFVVPVPGIVADRFILVMSLAWCVGFSMLVLAPGNLGFRKWGVWFYTGLLLFYSSTTVARNFNWKDDITLMRHDITYVDESAQANNLLAKHLMRAANEISDSISRDKIVREALYHFKSAVHIAPQMLNATYDIARCYTILNENDSALTYLNKAIIIDPHYYEAYFVAARLLYQQNKLHDAVLYCHKVIQLSPHNTDAYNLLSYFYFRLNQFQNSIAVNRVALKFADRPADAMINMGKVYEYTGRLDSAVWYYEMAYSKTHQKDLKATISILSDRIKKK